MNKKKMIELLKMINEAIAENRTCELTDYTREHAFIDIADAIELLTENVGE